MQPDHQKYLQWNGDRFIRWAEQIGISATVVVKHFLSMYKVEQQGYKSCMALLKLSDKYSSAVLEAACAKVHAFTPAPRLKSIQSILKSGTGNLLAAEEEPEQATPVRRGFTRGADYYRRDK